MREASQKGSPTPATLTVVSDRQDHNVVAKVALLVIGCGRQRTVEEQALAVDQVLQIIRPDYDVQHFIEAFDLLESQGITTTVNGKLVIVKTG